CKVDNRETRFKIPWAQFHPLAATEASTASFCVRRVAELTTRRRRAFGWCGKKPQGTPAPKNSGGGPIVPDEEGDAISLVLPLRFQLVRGMSMVIQSFLPLVRQGREKSSNTVGDGRRRSTAMEAFFILIPVAILIAILIRLGAGGMDHDRIK